MGRVAGENRPRTKKDVFRRNEPKDLLKIKELAFYEVKNELPFEGGNLSQKLILEIRNWKLGTLFSSFQFRVSNFRSF
jgi:hypothetical protein